MANIPIGGQIQVGSKTASVDAKYGPWASRAEAMEALGEEGMDAIVDGLTVGIIENGKTVEYWWQGGTELEHLVKKNDSLNRHETTQLVSEEVTRQVQAHDQAVNDIHYADSVDENEYPDVVIL